MSELLVEVRKSATLYRAWQHVRASGSNSKSPEIRRETKEFNQDAPKHLQRIYRQLLSGRFKFAQAIGIPWKKEGKKTRPLVLAPIESRIVQRALLDVLQSQQGIKSFVQTPYSFGGVPGHGVKEAIESVAREIKSGKEFFIRSDIVEFFRNIPRTQVIDLIGERLDDPEFLKFVGAATETELANLASLRQHQGLFPSHELGVAQGCCLSPLLGNILLHSFDEVMSSQGVRCIRYIDDFLLLAEDPRKVLQALERGIRVLEGLQLRAYHPDDDGSKAQRGRVTRGLEFLGCRICPGMVLPSKKSIKKVSGKIDELLKRSLSDLKAALKSKDKVSRGIVKTLNDVNEVLSAWAHAYIFCNPERAMRDFDERLEERINRYIAEYTDICRKHKHSDVRPLFGILRIADVKFEPIEWSTSTYEPDIAEVELVVRGNSKSTGSKPRPPKVLSETPA